MMAMNLMRINASKQFTRTMTRGVASNVVEIGDVDSWTKLQKAKKPSIGYFTASW
jgi:hypothetical protein